MAFSTTRELTTPSAKQVRHTAVVLESCSSLIEF
jgi:hypothetical protein